MKKILKIILVVSLLYIVWTTYRIFVWHPPVSYNDSGYCLTSPTEPVTARNIFTNKIEYWPGSGCLHRHYIPWWYKEQPQAIPNFLES